MNRIIKFRLYNKKSNRMIYPSKIKENSFENYYMDLRNGEIKYYQACYDGGFFDEDIIVMQFTGLYDKNGKEIYEGDIVVDREDEVMGQIIWNKEEASFYFSILYDNGTYEEEKLNDYISVLEVIGNIYDNKNLLEEE